MLNYQRVYGGIKVSTVSVSECPFCSDGPTSGRTPGTQFDEAVLLYAVSAWWTCEEEHCRLCVFSHVTWIQQVGAFCSSVDCIFFLDPFGSLKMPLAILAIKPTKKWGDLCARSMTNQSLSWTVDIITFAGMSNRRRLQHLSVSVRDSQSKLDFP